MTSDSAVSAVLAGLEKSRPWQEALYRDVHEHPELSHQEQRTAGLVAERLRGAGFEVHERVGGTGVVGVLRHGDGATVLMRRTWMRFRYGRRPGCRTPARSPVSTPMATRCR